MNLRSKFYVVVTDRGSTVGKLSSSLGGCGEKGVQKSLTAFGSLVRPSPAGCCPPSVHIFSVVATLEPKVVDVLLIDRHAHAWRCCVGSAAACAQCMPRPSLRAARQIILFSQLVSSWPPHECFIIIYDIC